MLYAVAIYICGLHACLFQVAAHHVLHLGHKDMERCDKISVITCKQCFAEKQFPSYRHDRRLFGKIDKIDFLQTVFLKQNLVCRPDVTPNSKINMNAVILDHLGSDNPLIVIRRCDAETYSRPFCNDATIEVVRVDWTDFRGI